MSRADLDLSASIVRVNNFFFEEQFFLGKRVDLVQVGGDGWLFPFYAKTLARAANEGGYSVSSWSCHKESLLDCGARILSIPSVPFSFRDIEAQKSVENLCAETGLFPTTGVLAVINAHSLGAKKITIVGMDLYSGKERYPHKLGSKTSAVVSEFKGYNERCHSLDLDLAVLQYLNSRDDVEIFRIGSNPSIVPEVISSPRLTTPSLKPCPSKKILIHDWVGWFGPIPFCLVHILRRARMFQIRLLTLSKSWIRANIFGV